MAKHICPICIRKMKKKIVMQPDKGGYECPSCKMWFVDFSEPMRQDPIAQEKYEMQLEDARDIMNEEREGRNE